MGDPKAESRSRRDWWEFVYRIVTGVVLVAIPIVIKFGADSIATSLETGRLVDSLIEDLTTREQHTRQDIALIALDAAVDDDKSDMVVRIAEQVLYSRPAAGAGAGLSPEDTVAFAIIRERAGEEESQRVLENFFRRNPERAKELAADIVRQETSRSAAETSAETAHEVPEFRQRDVPVQTQSVARVFKSIVYVQYHDPADGRMVGGLKSALGEAGLFVPGIERVESDYRNSIRYFHERDRDLAERVREATIAFFERQGRRVEFPAPQMLGHMKAPEGQIEVWIREVPGSSP
jgi:hypothetical protein